MTEGALGTLVALSYKGDGDDNYRVTRRIDLPVDEIVEAYESGLTTAEVGKLFGVSARPVQRILRDQGTTLRPRNSKATKHLPMDEIIQDYTDGASVRSLAIEHKVSADVVFKNLRRANVQLRAKFRVVPIADLVRYYESGDNSYVLATRYDVSQATILSRLKDAGVTMRHGKPHDLPDHDICEAYANGITMERLAGQYDVTPTCIRDHLIAMGALRPRQFHQRNRGNFRACINDGESVAHLAERIGASTGSIYNRLAAAKKTFRGVPLGDDEESEIIAIHATGKSEGEVARQLDRSLGLVRRVLRSRGIPPHPRVTDGWITVYGYREVSLPQDHPFRSMSRTNGRVAEHRLVMATHLGRPLLAHENVHHKNGQRADNRIENLELWNTSQPSGQRVEDKLSWCRDFLAQYEEWGVA